MPDLILPSNYAREQRRPVQLSYVDAATSTSTSITAPGGIASGDFAVFMDMARDNVTPSAVTPSGFTNVLNTSHFVATVGENDHRFMVSYKVLTGSETTISGMSGDGSGDQFKGLFVYRPNKAITAVTPLTGSSWGKEMTNSNPSSQSKTLVGLTAPVLYLGIAYNYNTVGEFSTASPAFDSSSLTAGSRIRFGRKLYNSAPANHTIDMNDLGSGNGLFSGYFTFT